MIILSLKERTPARMRSAILSAPQKADALEVRLDALGRLDFAALRTLFAGAPRPIIASCRRRRDGGGYSGSEESRKEVLWSALRAGASFLDLEFESGVLSLAERISPHADIGIIVSWHDRRRMPQAPRMLYQRMARVPNATVVKIVGTARSLSDVLEVKELLASVSDQSPRIISFAMGEAGRLSRIMALSWGSYATYVSRGEGAQTAPGQISLPDLIGVYRVEEIDRETRFAGIIGTPLGHTLSPVIQNAAFHAHGLNYRYVPLEITRLAELKHLKTIVRDLRLRGLSVTAPYKIKVMKHLDLVEPIARRIGAVNTVIHDGTRLVGFNTDATGGYAALRKALATQRLKVRGLTMAVVGSGGAARAIAHAVAVGGAVVIVSSRSAAPGRALARAVKGRWVPLGRLARESYDVLINCTPVGQIANGRPENGRLPVPARAIKGKLVYDLVYTPGATALLRAASRRRIPTLGGLEMLVLQGAEQYQLFSGRNAPVDMMREAARQELYDHRAAG